VGGKEVAVAGTGVALGAAGASVHAAKKSANPKVNRWNCILNLQSVFRSIT
jgi:hypothetical protein